MLFGPLQGGLDPGRRLQHPHPWGPVGSEEPGGLGLRPLEEMGRYTGAQGLPLLGTITGLRSKCPALAPWLAGPHTPRSQGRALALGL